MNYHEQLRYLQAQLNDIDKQLRALQRLDVNPPAGNVWVQKAGDTMTGLLAFANAALTVTRTNPPATNTYIYVETLNTDPLAQFWQDSADALGPILVLGKSRGTANQNNTVVQNGDSLGKISWYGADGVSNATPSAAASILVEVDGTPGNGDMPGRIKLQVTPDGSAAPVTALTIGQNKAAVFDGNVGVQDSTPDAPLTIRGPFARYNSAVDFVMGNSSDHSYIQIGQDATHNLFYGWNYNATAANAFADISTFAGSNDLALQASGGGVAIGATSWPARLSVFQSTLGSAVQQLSSTATNDDPTEVVYQNRAATTNATATTIHTFAIPASTTVAIHYVIIGRRTGGASGAAEDSFFQEGTAVYKNVGGTATLVTGGADTIANANDAGWGGAGLNVSTSNVQLQVTGAATTNITWHMTARVYAVSS